MQLGFIHFNNDARSKMMRMLQMIRDQQAIDELGLGRVRDAFSNLMFPGLSSLHQHAKYFILMPQIYREAERYGYASPRDVHPKIIELEIRLTRQLICGSPSWVTGITGSDVVKRSGNANKDKYVKYDPAYIYGGALRTFGIVTKKYPEQLIYARSKMRRNAPRAYKADEEGASDDDITLDGSEYLVLPPEPFDINTSKRSIFLTPDEAAFLKERITTAEGCRGSLLAHILKEDVEVGDDSEFVKVKDGQQFSIPFSEFDASSLPDPYAKQVRLAQKFAQFALPLNLRYMVIYHQVHGYDEAAEQMRGRFEEELGAAMEVYDKDVMRGIFGFLHIEDNLTRQFCLHAMDYAREGYSTKDYRKLDDCLRQREQTVKGDRRCKLKAEYEYDPDYSKNIYPMDFRWTRVVRMVNEIRKGIEGWQPGQ